MNLEIERKFLVSSDVYKKTSHQNLYIKQGFLNSHKNRTVRVRISGDQAYLTVKGVSNASGTSRFEWEKEVSISEAQQLMDLCEEGMIEKTRYYVYYQNHLFEVDEFLGLNQGLVIAEIELKNENEAFKKPDWLGEEVTGIIKYYNSQLSKHPYKNWIKENLNRS